MNFRIVMDSCGEMTPDMKQDERFVSAPLTIDINGYHITDDETFDQKDFLRRVSLCEQPPKSACPSPEFYRDAFACGAEHIYAVTLSAELSGSYNSAMAGRSMVLEDEPDKKIYVFNSRSASIGETLISLKIRECEESGMSFTQVIEAVEKYISEQVTWFVLESLEALRKNGRLSNLKARVATALHIKPVMISTPSGNIAQLTQTRGMNRALVKMVENIAETFGDVPERTAAIAHCNCPQRAQMVKEALLERMQLKDVLVLDTAGISSLYASDGGIIVVV